MGGRGVPAAGGEWRGGGGGGRGRTLRYMASDLDVSGNELEGTELADAAQAVWGAGELGDGNGRDALGGGPLPAMGDVDEGLDRVKGQRAEAVGRAGEVPQRQGCVPGRTAGQRRSGRARRRTSGAPRRRAAAAPAPPPARAQSATNRSPCSAASTSAGPPRGKSEAAPPAAGSRTCRRASTRPRSPPFPTPPSAAASAAAPGSLAQRASPSAARANTGVGNRGSARTPWRSAAGPPAAQKAALPGPSSMTLASRARTLKADTCASPVGAFGRTLSARGSAPPAGSRPTTPATKPGSAAT